MSERTLRVVVATPLPEQLRDLIAQREPRIDQIHDPALLPPMRWAGDSAGDPAFQRSSLRPQPSRNSS